MVLHLAHGIDLPDDGVTQTWGFIARKGAGKTYAAGKLVEELHGVGAPVVVIDPVGTWYGLRLAADGKSPGLPFPVFGGERGDVAIGAEQGEAVARLVLARNLSAVIDVSSFRKAERKRFVADFAERLFHEAKRNRTPRVVVFEEAQVFAPQRAGNGEERMLGAVEDIVRLGRNYGLGSVLISQRPQSVNKEVLNQVEALFVGQLSGPQERKAIDQWVSERSADQRLLDDLPSLPVGTMVLWSPQWLGILRKVRIAKKKTYDASATPELGARVQKYAPTPAQVDVEDLRAALEAASETPWPPAAGKGRAAALQRAPATNGEQARRVHELEAEVARLKGAVDQQRAQFGRALTQVVDQLQGVMGVVKEAVAHLGVDKPVPEVQQAARAAPKLALVKQQPAAAPAPAGDLRAGVLRMLEVLATFATGTMTKAQIARAAKMKVTGGTFATYWSTLKQQGLIEEASPKLFRITGAGLDKLGARRPDVPQTVTGRVAFWAQRLRAGEQRLLAEVLAAGEQGRSRAELAAAVQMAEGGGTFATYLSTLATNRLVQRQGGVFVPHPWLLTGSD